MKTILAFLFLAGSMASASQQASIVAAKGNTQILTLTPSTPSSARVKFEDKVYYVQKARIGAKLKGQDIVHTGPDGQLKAIYPSGELIFVGPGSAFAMPTVADQGSTTKGGTANLIYGKIRSLVTKQGSLKHFEVKTPAAVAGVRGTDFFVGYNGITGSTVTVLRGEVEVKTTSTANVAKSEPQVATVKPGFTAAVPVAPKTEEAATSDAIKTNPTPKVVVAPVSKEKLLEVQLASNVKNDAAQIAALPEAVQQEVKKLEEKSTTQVLADLKVTEPELYQKLSEQKTVDIAKVNTAVVSELYKAAPAETPQRKPSAEEIEDLGHDVYKKYFQGE